MQFSATQEAHEYHSDSAGCPKLPRNKPEMNYRPLVVSDVDKLLLKLTLVRKFS